MLGVGKARNRVSIPGTGEKISFFQSVQNGSEGPLSLLSNGSWGCIKVASQGETPISQQYPVPWLRMHASIASLPQMP